MTAAIAPGIARKQRAEIVRAPELLATFERMANDVAVLSLDCFDTILFRRTERPVDVFFDLAHAPAFAALGYAAKSRIESESRARSIARVRRGTTEVKLPEIYRAAFPELSDDEVSELARAELAAEKAACYAFPPTLELIRGARARGIPIVITSDTYLDERELRELMAATLPADAYAAITRVFCSSEYGRPKSAGLLEDVKRALGRKAASILHVGDHEVSDLEASHRAGMSSIRLVHHEPAVEQLLRAQAMAAALVAPDIRASRSLPSPFSGMLALERELTKPETLLGYAGAGPILYAFGRYVADELTALERAGARPKALFLMRDAYLPQLVAEDVAGQKLGTDVAMSRAVAYAASFRSPADVERYLARSAGSARIDAMARQLGLPDDVATRLIRDCERANAPGLEFARRAGEAKITNLVVERSAAFRKRLLRYLEKRVSLERGDTLVLVDLGYEGTAQRELGPVLEAELGVTVTGRYLLASRVPGWEKTRKGLFDPGSCDDRVLASLVPYVALLEDLCSSDAASVVDYDDGGEPLFSERVIGAEQYERIRPLQAECRRFARDAEAFFETTGKRPDPEALRTVALAALARLLFFPTLTEIEYLEGFRLDMNLATLDSFELFDRDKGLDGLRRRGAFFLQQPGSKSLRMNYPIELRSAGLELSLALFTHHRFSLGIALDDVTLRRETIPLLIADDRNASVVTLEARATYDGYYSLDLPLGEGNFSVAVLFGKCFAWVQLGSVEILPVRGLYDADADERALDVSDSARFDGMRHVADGLFECVSEAGFMLVKPERPERTRGALACRIVFRPVVARSTTD